MLSLAFSEPSDIFSIALIPIGVAAEPMPSRLADRLSDIYSSDLSLSPLNNRLLMGLNILLSCLLSPILSIISKTDSHIEYIAKSDRASSIDLRAPDSMTPNALSGDTTVSTIMDTATIRKNTKFISVKPHSILLSIGALNARLADVKRICLLLII